jgi:predicted peptidase
MQNIPFTRRCVVWLAPSRLIGILIWAMTTCVMSSATPNPQLAKEFDFKTSGTIRVNYLLHLPPGYKPGSDQKWPLILFLHGSGERGTNVWTVATHGPPHIATTNADFPFIVVSPQCAPGEHWQSEPLLGLLDEVMKRYSVDPRRVYLTGLSMGGYGAWELGVMHPEKFAAMAPICGGGQTITVILSSQERSSALKSLGVWAFHGAKDPVVPVEESERMVQALKRAGVKDVKLTIYPNAQHNSWAETYDNPELYKWFLSHERKNVPQ